jgi:caffeoyl-CoA O-methyltransferase
MSFKTVPLTEELHAYVVANGSEPDEVARDLLAETRTVLPDLAQLSIAPEQAAFLTLLTRVMEVRRAVEVGTFTGFSSLAIARGLADGGRLICFDISDEYTKVARRYWSRAGVEDRIELRLGPAAERLAELPVDAGLDLAFIDADKESYPAYWSALVPRMRSGGVLLADNVLSHGRVLDPGDSATARHIVAFNEMVRTDSRVDAMLLPIGDGLTFAVRR